MKMKPTDIIKAQIEDYAVRNGNPPTALATSADLFLKICAELGKPKTDRYVLIGDTEVFPVQARWKPK